MVSKTLRRLVCAEVSDAVAAQRDVELSSAELRLDLALPVRRLADTETIPRGGKGREVCRTRVRRRHPSVGL